MRFGEPARRNNVPELCLRNGSKNDQVPASLVAGSGLVAWNGTPCYVVGAGGSDGGGFAGSAGATAAGCCASGMMGTVMGAGVGVTSPWVVSIVLSPS